MGDLTGKNVHIAEVEILHTVNIIVTGCAINAESILDDSPKTEIKGLIIDWKVGGKIGKRIRTENMFSEKQTKKFYGTWGAE